MNVLMDFMEMIWSRWSENNSRLGDDSGGFIIKVVFKLALLLYPIVREFISNFNN